MCWRRNHAIMKVTSVVKFRVEFVSRETLVDERLRLLAEWCVRFDKSGLTPQREGTCRALGNLSFRLLPDSPAFMITASALSSKNGLAPDDFVTVLRSDPQRKIVTAIGAKDPSSESMMHYEIYERRSDVGAIFHGHDQEIVQGAAAAGLPVTAREEPAGSPELLNEVVKRLYDGCFIVMKNHGFLSLGETMDDAGSLALRIKQAIANGNICGRRTR